jgi:pilus assembly protein CpaC
MRTRKEVSLAHFALRALALACIAVMAGPAVAEGVEPAESVAGESAPAAQPLDITLGKSQLVDLKEPISRVAVGNPSVADVKLLNRMQVYVLGTGIGSTNVMFWNKAGQVLAAYDVMVNRDVSLLRGEIIKLVPQGGVQVRAVGDHIVLEGKAPSPDLAERLVNVVTAFGHKNVVNLLVVDKPAPAPEPPPVVAPAMDTIEVIRGTAKTTEQFKAKAD